MFNLDQAIAEWRRQMRAEGIKTPVPLDELEGHLREDLEMQMSTGLSAENALKMAVQKMGQASTLKSEFKKNERTSMKRRIIIGIGVIGLLLGTTMVLPALGKHKQRNLAALSTGASFFNVGWAKDEVYGLRLGTALAIVGAGVALYGFSKRSMSNRQLGGT